MVSQTRKIAELFRHTPLHPQWLLGPRHPGAVTQLRGKVLDVGCAHRWVEQHCADGVQYIGLDYPPTGSRLYSASPDVFADAAHLPLVDACMDAVVCLEVLEHVRDYDAALSQFSRVLKPGGKLLLSMPFLYPVHDAPHDYQRLTEFGLQRDLARVDFNIVRLAKVGHAIRAAGLLLCLALVGGLDARRRWFDYLRVPFAAAAVFIVNVAAFALSKVLPDWSALGTGYVVEAIRRNT